MRGRGSRGRAGLFFATVVGTALLAAACLPPSPAAPGPTTSSSSTSTTATTAAPASICGVSATATQELTALVRKNGKVEVLRREVRSAQDEERFRRDAAAAGEVLAIAPDAKVHALGQTETWGFTAVGFRAAWSVPTATTGAGVRVAVLDTGVDAGHPDLAGRVVNGEDFVNRDGSGNPTSGATDDPNGHGTHVAGVVAADDNTIGVVGGAPGVTIVPGRVLDASGTGKFSDVAAAILWAADPAGGNARIINLSLGGPSSTVVDAAVETAEHDPAYDHAVVVAAAGNSACSTPLSPASAPGALAVAALCQTGTPTSCPSTSPFPADPYQLATFSSRAPDGVAAPGVKINSTFPPARDTSDGTADGYTVLSGTSMATPFVAAVAALVVAHCPSDSADAVIHRIQVSARDLGPPGHDSLYGYGAVDADNAVAGC